MEILKVPGSENMANIFTKNLGHWLTEQHLAAMNLEYSSSRAVTAAQFHSLRKARAELTKAENEINAIKSAKAAIPASRKDQWVSHPSNRILIHRYHALRLCMCIPLIAERLPN